ncbi:FG-GAP repeat domain-containing protein [Tundrisphaera sp. TA3]|uniref:FG-GAP repeat domain-containing protein n=1 Tax=Tundrisphaera sp. TA3 TaxID=3435775 RepID=UPI003EBE6777
MDFQRGKAVMMEFAGRRWMLALGLVTLAALAAGGASADEDVRLADYYGFLPVEVYKLDNRISNILTADLDGDKVADVAVSNNARSRIDLLLSTRKPGDDDAGGAKKEVNDIVGDRRMRLVSIPVNKEVVSLQAGDLDGDGKADLVYYGTPAGIEILSNRGGGKFSDPRKLQVGEAVESAGALAVADLDGDGRDDIALLTREEIIVFRQREKGKLGDPERWPHTLDNPRMVKAVDMDGDGKLDLAMLDGGQDDPIRVRFATGEGRYGPEERFEVEPLRAYAFGQVDGKPGDELVTIEQQSGRARVATLAEQDDESEVRGRLSFTPLPPGAGLGRSLDLGDLDGDGKIDVVATDPARAQLVLYRQSGTSGLGQARTFPGLAGGGPVRLADFDGDGKAEVIVLSEKERQIGRSVLIDDRLTFPVPLPIVGEPVTLAAADLDGDKTPEILYVTREKTENSTADSFALRALARGKDKSAPFAPYRWGQADIVPLKGINGVPPEISVIDANRDGRADVLVFNAYGPPVLLLGRAGDIPTPPAEGLGPLAGASPGGLTMADLGGPALLVAQQASARDLLLDADGHWVVKDQFDAGRSSAQVEGVAALDFDGDGVKEVVLLDRADKKLVILARKGGTYVPSGTLSVGPFDDFRGMRVADLDGDGRDDLLLAGTSRFGVVLAGKKGRRLKVIASYEPEREDARLGDLIVGDLNNDGKPDIALTDIAEHFVEIATYAGKPDMARALAFKVFERKGRRSVADMIEPRDLTLGDVDGDGRTDLILLVHDRILIYRQDPGQDRDKGIIKAAEGQ